MQLSDSVLPQLESPNLGITSRLRDYNYPASEATHISQLLSAAKQERVELESCLLILENRRRNIAWHISRCESLLSPVRKVTNEILVKIFRLCCRIEIGPGKRVVIPALNVRSVCKGWQAAVDSTEDLWSWITLHIDAYDVDDDEYGSDEYSERQARILSIILQRSGNTGLTIELRSSSNATSSNESASDYDFTAFEKLQKQSDRWISLTASLQPCLQSRVLTPLRGSVSQLQIVELHLFDYGNLCELSDGLEIAPSLYSFKLTTEVWEPEISLPWTQITHIGCFWRGQWWNSNGADFLSTVISFSCAICVPDDDEDGDDREVAMSAPVLEDLQLCVWPGYTMDNEKSVFSFPLLAAPKLRALTLYKDKMHEINELNPDSKSAYIDLEEMNILDLLRSGYALTSLSITDVHVMPEQLVVLLKELPLLVFLQIKEPNDSNNSAIITTQLAMSMNPSIDPYSNIFLPSLQKIDFDLYHRDNVQTHAALMEMIIARWRPSHICCLKCVELSVPDFDQPHLRTVQRLYDQGMAIAVVIRSG